MVITNGERPAPRINDIAFKIGTVNGTGSASANGLLRRAIFRMGIPVSGKNLFPSNIQGLPTWYEIRANARGHTARTERFDLVVAMNPATYARDVAEVTSGGWVMYDSTWPLPRELDRDDVTFLGVPLAKMTVDNFKGSRVRILMKNICYVGALAALLDIDMEIVRGLLKETFAAKAKLLDANYLAIDLGYEYALEHFDCPLPVRLEPMAGNEDSIVIDGNTAAALGCVYAGATVAAWYPITPSTSLVDAFTAFCHQFRKDPETGRNRFAIIQAEDELAAAGMVIGAAWAGCARIHLDERGRAVAHERVHRAGVLRRGAVGVLRRAAGRSVDRDADADPAGRHPVRGLRVARRHEAHRHLPCQPPRVLRDGGGGVRPGRTVPDADLRPFGPGHRHERLGHPEARMGRFVPAGPRQGADRRGARGGDGALPPLPGCGRRRDPVADAAGGTSQGGVPDAGLGSRPVRQLHRGLGAVCGRAGACGTQDRASGRTPAGARDSAARRCGGSGW